MKRVVSIIVLVWITGAGSHPVYAGDEVQSLSPELRALLQQEMTAIESAMQSIISAYVSGDLDKIEGIARQMENSFILKQKITESQKQELHEKLPQDFIEKDKQSHRYAGMLEMVSSDREVELVGFYYTKLLESCVSCHSDYATHRFPGLKNRPDLNDVYYQRLRD